MSAELRVVIELIFNVSYLLVIWTLVILFLRQIRMTPLAEKPVLQRLIWAFGLLALGDTGHVGFRVIAYLQGGLEANSGLVGMGALGTAVTITFFYMILLDIWRIRYNKTLGWFEGLLLAAGIIRLVILAFPQNQWESLVPPYGWSLLRNSFLVIQGLGVMFLILRDSSIAKDTPFRLIGWMIGISYLFYAPVILWSAAVPLLGMLMIPKTCAYVAAAIIAYNMVKKNDKQYS
jgi:hypothetical protein